MTWSRLAGDGSGPETLTAGTCGSSPDMVAFMYRRHYGGAQGFPSGCVGVGYRQAECTCAAETRINWYQRIRFGVPPRPVGP